MVEKEGDLRHFRKVSLEMHSKIEEKMQKWGKEPLCLCLRV